MPQNNAEDYTIQKSCVESVLHGLLQPTADGDKTAATLVRRGGFGAEVVRIAEGGETGPVEPHPLPGDLVVFAHSGRGVLVSRCVAHELTPGVCCLVPAGLPYAIEAHTELMLICITNRPNYEASPAKPNLLARNSLDDQSVADLKLSVRARKACVRAGAATIGQLRALSENDLLEIPNCGVGTVEEIARRLEAVGLSLAPDRRYPAVPPLGLPPTESAWRRVWWKLRWREKEIARLRFGLGPDVMEHTLEEIAEMFRCNPRTIARLLRGIEKKLAAVNNPANE